MITTLIKKYTWICFTFLLLSFNSYSATRTASLDGNWTSLATWSTVQTGDITTSTASTTVTVAGVDATTLGLAWNHEIYDISGTLIGKVNSVSNATTIILQANAASDNTNITWRTSKPHTTTDDYVIPASYTVTAATLHSNQFGSLTVSGDLNITGTFTIKQWVADPVSIENGGKVNVGLNLDISDNITGSFTVKSGGVLKIAGSLLEANNIYKFHNYGYIEVNGSVIGVTFEFNNYYGASLLVHDNITGSTGNFVFNNWGIVTVDNNLTMEGVYLYNKDTGKLIVYGDLTLQGSGIYDNAGFVQSNNFFLINLTDFSNTGTSVVLEEFNVSWTGCPCNEGSWYLNTIFLANPGAPSCVTATTCSAHWGNAGNIEKGRRLWLNAGFPGYGQGIDGDKIYQWFDLANTFGFKMREDIPINQPIIDNNATNNINYNPVVSFEASDVHLDLDSNYLFAPNIDGGVAIFAVTKPKPSSSGDQFVFDFGLYNTDGYGLMHSASDIKAYTSGSDGGNINTYTNAYGDAPVLISQTTEWSSNQILYVNGISVDTKTITLDSLTGNNIDTSAISIPGVSGPFLLGGSSTNPLLKDFDGEIAELIIYAHMPPDTTRNATESFLGLKYAISLPHDYTDYFNDTVYRYDATYTNDIFGLAREDLNLLHQRQSKRDILLLASDTPVAFDQRKVATNISSNSSYFITGHNGNSIASGNRIYKATSTNFNQAITLEFEIAGLSSPYDDLYVSSDEAFTTPSIIAPDSYVGDKLTYTHTFSNNSTEYFKLATHVVVPREPGVGINREKAEIDTSAELHIYSTTRGVLLPSLTTAQMNAIASPPNGLIIYNTDQQRYMYNSGTDAVPSWVNIGRFKTDNVVGLTAAAGSYVGEIRYNTDDNTLWYWNGTSWLQLKDN